MASENETIADIVAEMRGNADRIERDVAEKMRDGRMVSDRYARELVADIRARAERIEAAWKREKAEAEAGALAVGGIVEAARQKPVGNSAAHAMTLDEAIAHAEDVAGKCDTSCKIEHRQLADWLKELRDLRSRPVGNSAAMREALTDICRGLETKIKDRPASVTAHEMAIYKRCKAALSAPPRQCDVGTAEEQAERFKGFCGQFDCYECPLGVGAGKVYYCALKWAQMPYEAERKGEGDD